MQRIKLEARPAPVILLDCGAFTAWKSGISISLDAYIKYVQRHRHLIACYLNLDIIPGSEGRREWDAELIERAAQQSHANLLRMKDAELHPVPVFHRGDAFQWLERMLFDGETSIALAALPFGGTPRHEIMGWLDVCFSIIGQTPVKVHGLAMTSPMLLHLYPWTSVDSRTWFFSAALGHIPVPIYVDDQPNYKYSPTIVTMTDRSSHANNYLDRLIEYDQNRVHRYLNEVGIDREEARYGHRHRQLVWAYYWQGLEASCGTRIFFVTDTTRGLTKVLDQGQARHRLLSYFKLKDLPDHALEDYMAGRMRPPPTRRRHPVPWSDQDCDERALARHQYLKELDAEDAARRATSKLVRVKMRRD